MYSRKFVSYIEKLLKGVCNDAHEDDPIWGNEDGVEYFMALICGEPLPEISDDDDEDDEEELSLETMCYLFNYERFTQNGPGRVSAK